MQTAEVGTGMYQLELMFLHALGYVRQGNYMIAPGGVKVMDTFQILGQRFLESDTAERQRMIAEFSGPKAQQTVVEEFLSPKAPYAAIMEFRLHLAFIIMVSPWFEPRDLVQFLGEICDRAVKLLPQDVREVTSSLSHLMDSTEKTTNLGRLSTRSLVLDQVNQNLNQSDPDEV
jgi:hypothetical protein